MIVIYAAAADRHADLGPLLDQYDRARTPAEQERVASGIYGLVSPAIKSLISRSAGGRRLDPDALGSLAWEALTRGLSESGMTRLGRKDANWDEFVRRIQRTDYPPAERLWGLLPFKLREKLKAPYLKMTSVDELIRELNALLVRRDFYDPRAWAGVSMSDEDRQMASLQAPTPPQLSRFNALALASAFPEITVPPQPTRNLMGYISGAVLKQMLPRIYEESAGGRELDHRAIDVWSALKPFVQQVDEMAARGTLPDGWERMSKAERIYRLETQDITQRIGPRIQWWNDRVAELQPENPFKINSKEALRDAKELFRAHPDRVPPSLWDGEQSRYYVPKIAVAPFGVRSIERMLASAPRSASPDQALSAAAPQQAPRPTEQALSVANQPRAYQMIAQHIFGGGQYDVERAVAEFLSASPRPSQQQVAAFLQSAPPDVAELIREIGFPALAREVDQRIMAAMDEPETQAWLAMALGGRQRSAVSLRATILIVTPGAMRLAASAKSRCA